MEGKSRRVQCAGLAALCAAALAGSCGQTRSSPRAVHLTVTAPIDGAAVAVRSVVVFGKVDPAGAAVTVAGKHPRVMDGVFRQPMALRRGLNHIELVASAAGYMSAREDLEVRSSARSAGGSTPRRAVPRDFARAASVICARSSTGLGAIRGIPGGPSPRRAMLIRAHLLAMARQLGRLRPPPALKASFESYLRLLRFQAALMPQLAADLKHHDMAAAKRHINFDYGVASDADEIARSLGMVGC
jgi:hypothetical protein